MDRRQASPIRPPLALASRQRVLNFEVDAFVYCQYCQHCIPTDPCGDAPPPAGRPSSVNFFDTFCISLPPRPHLGALGRHFDPFWHHLGPMSVLLGSFFGFSAPFGPHVGAFGPLFSIFGAVWGSFFKLQVGFALHVHFDIVFLSIWAPKIEPPTFGIIGLLQ